MTKKEDVEEFLKNFKLKLNIYDIVFLDGRQKNSQTLLDLEIPPSKRIEVIKKIKLSDYSEGP